MEGNASEDDFNSTQVQIDEESTSGSSSENDFESEPQSQWKLEKFVDNEIKHATSNQKKKNQKNKILYRTLLKRNP